MTEEPKIKPLKPISRVDVFAETKRLKAIAHGETEVVGQGYGIRIAKIVASKRFGGGSADKSHQRKKTHRSPIHWPRAALAASRAPSSERSTVSFNPMSPSTTRSWIA